MSNAPGPATAGVDAPVRVEGLSFGYGRGAARRDVLHDVSLAVGAGEVVLLTGPSGSGKTTLLTVVGGLRAFGEGRVDVLGLDLGGAGPAAVEALRGRLGFVFQRPSLLRSLSLVENVGLALVPGVAGPPEPERRARALAALADVGLADRAEDLPETLSGGQQQRVAVARAMVRRPPLLLADEPTASLDGQNGRAVATRMVELARSIGTAVILSTHDERIFDVADRRLHLVDGRLVD